MNSLIIIACIAGAALAIFLFWRRSQPKRVAPEYPVVGMWDLAGTVTKIAKYTPLRQMLWFKSEAEAHHFGDLAAAFDRAYNRIQNDVPKGWAQGRAPGDYMAMIVSDTYPAASGAPSLKVTPVPAHLKGTRFDKGGFILAAGATFLPPKFKPALMVIPNITSVDHIDTIETGFKHEAEHVCVFANDPDLHAGLAWFEQHPFLPLQGSLVEDGSELKGEWIVCPVE